MNKIEAARKRVKNLIIVLYPAWEAAWRSGSAEAAEAATAAWEAVKQELHETREALEKLDEEAKND